MSIAKLSTSRRSLSPKSVRAINIMTLEYQHTFSPGTLNTARFGFNRSVQEAENVRTADIPANLSFVPGEPPGYITFRAW